MFEGGFPLTALSPSVISSATVGSGSGGAVFANGSVPSASLRQELSVELAGLQVPTGRKDVEPDQVAAALTGGVLVPGDFEPLLDRLADRDPAALVFPTATGREMDSHNVRRAFRSVARLAGLEANDWTPRELRHSFVSLLSHSGVRIEQIARLLGHSGTAVTERVYRHELRPVLEEGAETMDVLFPRTDAG